MEVTEREYRRYRELLIEVENGLDIAQKEKSRAAALGDLRENEEFATASARVSHLLNQKREIEKKLEDMTIIHPNQGPTITVGCSIQVTKVTERGEPLSDPRVFEVAAEGDTVTRQILGVSSPLGKEILNGTSGRYFIQAGGGIWYDVKKISSKEVLQ